MGLGKDILYMSGMSVVLGTIFWGLDTLGFNSTMLMVIAFFTALVVMILSIRYITWFYEDNHIIKNLLKHS